MLFLQHVLKRRHILCFKINFKNQSIQSMCNVNVEIRLLKSGKKYIYSHKFYNYNLFFTMHRYMYQVNKPIPERVQ